jgi:hypothetical protein
MRIRRPTQASVRWIIIGLAAAGFLAGVYLQVTAVNTTLRRWDQGAYFDFIKEVRESDFRFTGQRNRMPLYPYLQAPFFNPDASEEESFSRAKTVNVFLSLAVLAIFAFAFYKRLRRPSADLLLAILAFTVFAWRAAYLQCELVNYALAFWSWVAMSNQIERPSWWRASSIAVAAALTHFTKASILPGLAVFLIIFVFAGLSSRREFSRRALQSVWIVALFLGLLSPYLIESKEKYGRYFYNVNSTFYFWYDSWDECSRGTKAHGDRLGWPDMPDEDIPSLGRYLERHDVGDIARRMLSGLVKNLGCFVERKGNNYGRLVFLSLLFAGLLMWRGEGKVPARRRSLRVFQIGWILTYFLLFAWYAPIAHGNRFTQSLLLPILYPLFHYFDTCEDHSRVARIGGHRLTVPAVRRVLAIVLLAYILFEFVFAIHSRSGYA